MTLFLIAFYTYILASISGFIYIFVIWRNQRRWEKANGTTIDLIPPSAIESQNSSKIERIPFLDVDDIIQEKSDRTETLPTYRSRRVRRLPLWRIPKTNMTGRQKHNIRNAR